ncbi:hypothetical protein DPEC_G00344580 [Dallia pectoralis]|uniref:Uncharacterized protein n=1 Tax=Dallia pectoralis TaxID=75939 RepID=A0ACC2F3B1_DALPE|nr:hypothetical protein DPEC_G00344580 [Dallia pectoralis]
MYVRRRDDKQRERERRLITAKGYSYSSTLYVLRPKITRKCQINMENSREVAILVPHMQQEAVYVPDRVASAPGVLMEPVNDDQQQQQAADSLIQVIEKLSKIVEKRPRRCTLAGKKRALLSLASVRLPASSLGEDGASPCKIARESEEEVEDYKQNKTWPSNSAPSGSRRTITCYQCSLCRFLSPTLSQLKEHLRQHDEQHSDLILMCSECHFTSRRQEELEAHVRLHFEDSDLHSSTPSGQLASAGDGHFGPGSVVGAEDGMSLEAACTEEIPAKKKWYSYEEYGMYRCLICSYVCGQQRMLKTHAWKHAGLVDCSYPIFEDEAMVPSRREITVPLAPYPAEKSRDPVVAEKPSHLHKTSPFQVEIFAPAADCDSEPAVVPAANLADPPEDSKDPAVEVQVTAELELAGATDSLLSSAQKIISCSPNSAGHVNVIVERLPGVGEQAAAQTIPMLLSPETDRDDDKNRTMAVEADLLTAAYKDEQWEMAIGWGGGERQTSAGPPSDENVPPVRRRTHSESLRLHSLAAEALVTMPMRTPEHAKLAAKSVAGLGPRSPDVGQRVLEEPDQAPVAGEKMAGGVGDSLVDLELQGYRENELAEGPTKAGISLSLLTVIERLRERSDQNASDEDILRELQDNAQSQHAGGGAGDPGVPDLSLVEYSPGSERPYRCRLCRYSSGNKGYIKQHLRVHRQRQAYECPICEHIALNSRDLEGHMINHCKTRKYHCQQCAETFSYKSQLRSHERDQHGLGVTAATLTPVTETTATTEESEKMTDDDVIASQKFYKCDVCDYTSSTYVGVRNHRRIHNSDKPYRCCSCDFATTNMNSLKSHMRRHPQEHQAVQLLEQYRCSLCGYVCSHPPSLKSHMWKHAGDQNYNYEQVNQAINEAISQSSRVPCVHPKAPGTGELATEWSGTVTGTKEEDRPPADHVPSAELFQGSSREPAHLSDDIQRKEASQAQASQAQASQAQTVPSRAGMEYCMLLFCCCICGFESTSKERLMEHMKEHEGDIISIILNKQQEQQAAAPPAEGSTVQ